MSRTADSLGQKYRQAAFVYLHVGLLYIFAVWVLNDAGLIPGERGPVWVWLAFGAAILGAVFWGLWSWQNAWFARVIWVLHALRMPALVAGAFFPATESPIPSSFYLTALVVVLINLGMLARAAWDL